MNTDSLYLEDDYGTIPIVSTSTTKAPAGTISNDSLGGGGINDFFNSLAGAFGNAATGVVNAAGAAAAGAINPAGEQTAKPITPAATNAAKPNYTLWIAAAAVIAGAIYLARRES